MTHTGLPDCGAGQRQKCPVSWPNSAKRSYKQLTVSQQLSKAQGSNLWGYGVSHPLPTLKICHFTGHKRQYKVFVQGNSLDPRPLDQLLLLKTFWQLAGCRSYFRRAKLLTPLPPKYNKATSLPIRVSYDQNAYKTMRLKGHSPKAYKTMRLKGHSPKKVVRRSQRPSVKAQLFSLSEIDGTSLSP